MGRSIFAVVAGLVMTLFLGMTGSMVAMAALLERPPVGQAPVLTPAYAAVTIGVSLAAAAIGGIACAAFARRNPVLHGLLLAAVLLAVTLPLAAGGRARGLPAWYAPLKAAAGAVGAISGAFVHRALTARRPEPSV